MDTHEGGDFADELVFGFDVVFWGFEGIFAFRLFFLMCIAVIKHNFL